MAAQLKALTELVQQLQADNSRLREEVTRISAPTPGGAGPSGNSTGQATTSVCFLSPILVSRSSFSRDVKLRGSLREYSHALMYMQEAVKKRDLLFCPS